MTLALMLGGLTMFGVFVGVVSISMVSRLRGQLEVQELDIDELSDHVVICGWNHSGKTVLRELFGPGTPSYGRCVVLVSEEPIPDELRLPHRARCAPSICTATSATARGNRCSSLSGIRRADSVILAAGRRSGADRSNQDRDARTVLTALTIERMAQGIYTVAELHSRQSEDAAAECGRRGRCGSRLLLGHDFRLAAAKQVVSSRVLDDILTQSHGNAFHTQVLASPRGTGRTVAEAAQASCS